MTWKTCSRGQITATPRHAGRPCHALAHSLSATLPLLRFSTVSWAETTSSKGATNLEQCLRSTHTTPTSTSSSPAARGRYAHGQYRTTSSPAWLSGYQRIPPTYTPPHRTRHWSSSSSRRRGTRATSWGKAPPFRVLPTAV